MFDKKQTFETKYIQIKYCNLISTLVFINSSQKNKNVKILRIFKTFIKNSIYNVSSVFIFYSIVLDETFRALFLLILYFWIHKI